MDGKTWQANQNPYKRKEVETGIKGFDYSAFSDAQ